MKMFLDQDNDCHWYLVDAYRRKEWETWKDLDSEDPKSWECPEYARAINTDPSRVVFEIDFEKAKIV